MSILAECDYCGAVAPIDDIESLKWITASDEQCHFCDITCRDSYHSDLEAANNGNFDE